MKRKGKYQLSEDGWMCEIERWRRPVPLKHKPYFSINPRGELAMNRAAHKMLDFTYRISLCFSAERGQLGLVYNEFTLPMYEVRKYGRGGNMRVARIGAGLKYFGISITETTVFRSYSDFGDRIIALTLSTGVPFKQYRAARHK